MIYTLYDPFSVKGRVKNTFKYITKKLPLLIGFFVKAVKNPKKIYPYLKKKNENKNQKFPPPILNYLAVEHSICEKKALMTYVASPFYLDFIKNKPGHSNGYQAIEIAKAFNRIGYIVDIVDYLDDNFIPNQKYDVFFGMHYNYERLQSFLDKSTKTIYYATGTYWAYETLAEQKRVLALKERRGVELNLPIRLNKNNWVETADAVIVMANQFTLNTYIPHRPQGNIYTIDNSTIEDLPDINLSNKDFLHNLDQNGQ